MYPGAPTCIFPAGVTIHPDQVDETCQAWLVTQNGTPIGVWLDDTTPNLEACVKAAVAKYAPLHQRVLVCVPPSTPHLRHTPTPPVVNVQEWYPFGDGIPVSEWPPMPAADAYCLQARYPGAAGTRPPGVAARRRLLEQARAHHPEFVFLF